jgi:hypothetical protein
LAAAWAYQRYRKKGHLRLNTAFTKLSVAGGMASGAEIVDRLNACYQASEMQKNVPATPASGFCILIQTGNNYLRNWQLLRIYGNSDNSSKCLKY